MADGLARAVSRDGGLRVLAAVTTAVAEDGRVRHGTLPTATAALGRAMTGAVLLANTLSKRDERLSLEFSGDGPLRQILVDATPEGDVRGFVQRPQTHLPPRNGKLDVGGAMGRGVLCVMRVPLDGGSLYRSVVPLESGEIGQDLARYLLESEQTLSALGVGVWVESDGRVGASGGFLVQALPGADPAVLDRVADRVERLPPPSDMVREGLDARGIVERLLGDLAGPMLEERPVRYRCRCSRERVLAAIMAMGRGEIERVLADDRRAEVLCEFCGARYDVGEDELRRLLAPA
jgi:molecular chaperone Hsp33